MLNVKPIDDEEERRRREEQAARDAQIRYEQQQQAQIQEAAALEQQDAPIIESQGPARAAASTKAAKRDEGWMTQIGNVVESIATGDWMNDALDAVAPDVFKSQQELEQMNLDRARQIEQEGNPVEKLLVGTNTNLEAVDESLSASIMLPFTAGARMANQRAPWNEAPTVVKESPLAETIYNIGKVIWPSLFLKGVGVMPANPAALLATESAVETIGQDSIDDYIGARQAAQAMGELWQRMGGDGEALVKDIIEGKTIQSNALNFIGGFFHNMGLNKAADSIVRGIQGFLKNAPVDEATERAAKQLGKTPEEVQQALDNTNPAPYTTTAEPTDVIDIDNAVPVGAPTNANISEDVLMHEWMQYGLNPMKFVSRMAEAGQQRYFLNLKPIASEPQVRDVIDAMTEHYQRLPAASIEKTGIVLDAIKFWKQNPSLLDPTQLKFVKEMAKYTRNLGNGVPKGRTRASIEKYLKENAVVTESGFLMHGRAMYEVATRAIKAADQVTSLDSNHIDFSNSVENMIELWDKMQLFAIPLRRAKRLWHVGGEMQQGETMRMVKALDETGVIKKYFGDPSKMTDADIASKSPSKAFTDFQKINSDETYSFRDLWEQAKQGDADALETVKQLAAWMTTRKPSSLFDDVETNLSQMIKDLQNQTPNAFGNLFMSSLLSSAKTISKAYGGTVARQVTEPAIGMAKNLVKMVNPLSDTPSAWEEFNFYRGMWHGQKAYMDQAMDILNHSIKTNIPINGTSRWTDAPQTLRQQSDALDNQFVQIFKEMNRQNVGNFSPQRANLLIHYLTQRALLNPLVSAGPRMLMAGDQATITSVAGGIINAKAYREAARNNDWKNLDKLIEKYTREVFIDGDIYKGVKDPEAMSWAQLITFQRDIPKALPSSDAFLSPSNATNKLFGALSDAAKDSEMMRWIFPFTKMAWEVVNQGTTVLTGMVPVVGPLMARMDPALRAVMNGNDEAAKMQIKNLWAVGTTMSMSAAALAWNGHLTGQNGQNGLARNSVIIPGPNGENLAISYEWFQPYGQVISIVADLVNGFRDGVIERGQYEEYMNDLIASITANYLDSSILTGLTEATTILDWRNLDAGWFKSAGNLLATPVSWAAGRQYGRVFNPYSEPDTQTDNHSDNFWSAIRRRMYSDGLIPGAKDEGYPMYDPYTNQPITNTATATGGDYWDAVAAAAVNQFMPMRVVNVPKADDSLRQKMNQVGFRLPKEFFRTVDNIPLTRQEQSFLSETIGAPNKMKQTLRERLDMYFRSRDFNNAVKAYQAARKDQPMLPAYADTVAQEQMKRIHSTILAIHTKAKQDAVQVDQRINLEQRRLERYANMHGGEELSMKPAGIYSSLRDSKDEQIQALLNLTNV